MSRPSQLPLPLRHRVGTMTLALCWLSTVLHADPSATEQYWLELINRARLDPAGELGRLVEFRSPGVWDNPKANDPNVASALDYFGTDAGTLQSQWNLLNPAPPLAWSDSLANSAGVYSNLMVSLDAQSHTLDGQSLSDRILGGGYTSNYLELGESLFSATASIEHGHAAFAIDWGDDDANSSNGFGTGIQTPALHRELLFDGALKQIGIGFQSIPIPTGNTVADGPLVTTQHYGSSYRWTGTAFVSDAIITGSVYRDNVTSDLFYTPGEGVAAAAIEVWDQLTNTLVLAGATNAAGGFNLVAEDLIAGREYAVRAPGQGAPEVTFIASSEDRNYGATVTVFDNVYASFQAAPEPSSALLCLAALSLIATSRHRLSCARP